MIPGRCEDCLCVEPEPLPDGGTIYHCRRFPPVYAGRMSEADNRTVYQFPVVHPKAGCWEFKPKTSN